MDRDRPLDSPLLRRLHPRRGVGVLALLEVFCLRRGLAGGVGELVHLLVVVIVRNPQRPVGVILRVRVFQNLAHEPPDFRQLHCREPMDGEEAPEIFRIEDKRVFHRHGRAAVAPHFSPDEAGFLGIDVVERARRPRRDRLGVVLAAGQRRQAGKLQDVERQLALDDLDAADDRFRRVGGEADDVAAIGDAAVLAPLEQKLAVVGDVVPLLLRRDEVVGVDVLEADEYALDAGRAPSQ